MVKIFRQQALGLCLSMPAIILMLTLLICPVFLVMMMSFSDYSLGDASFSWVGIDNYREMMKDSIFHKAILNTAIYAIIVIPGSLLLGLAAALLIDSLSVGKGFWRAAYFCQ